MTLFIRSDISEAKEDCMSIPYRAFDLMEFLKKVKETQEVLAIELDGHTVTFITKSIDTHEKRSE